MIGLVSRKASKDAKPQSEHHPCVPATLRSLREMKLNNDLLYKCATPPQLSIVPAAWEKIKPASLQSGFYNYHIQLTA